MCYCRRAEVGHTCEWDVSQGDTGCGEHAQSLGGKTVITRSCRGPQGVWPSRPRPTVIQ